MFRSGGPIKEGIMDGMKEPQMSNTVGSPLAPQDSSGRQKYAIQFAPLVFAAGRALARPFGQFVARQSRGGKLLGLKPVEKFQPNIFGKYLAASPEGRLLTGGAGLAGKTGSTIFKGAKSLAKSPLTVAAGLYYGGGALLPDGTPDPNDPKNIKSGEGRQFTGDEAMVGDPRKPLPDSKPKPNVDDLTKDRIEANRERYYKLMGIDKMQKGAAYDSLIDASKIIQEEGGDLKGSLKSGALQTRIIDAISKNLDKSADLKKQIDAAILKGEIQKDIKASDPSAKLAAELTKKKIDLADKQLSGGSLIENIQAGAKADGGINSTNNVYNSVIRSLGVEPTILKDTSETIKLRKLDDYTTDADLVKKIVEAENKGPGVYIIDKSVILVDENGNTRTLALG